MIYSSRDNYDVPRLDVLTFLFDSPHTLATDSTIIHASAANPSLHITKAAARSLTKRIAHTLRTRFGIGANGPGKDVVLVMSTGQILLPVLFYGIIAAGGVVSCASYSFQSEELARQIKHGKAKLCIACRNSKDVLTQAATGIKGLEGKCLLLESDPQRLSLLGDTKEKNIIGKEVMDWERVVDEKELEERLVCLLYSSGTTGPPKGVLMSHMNLVSEAFLGGTFLRDFWKTHGKWPFSTLGHLPAAHVAGVMGYFVIPFYHGGTTYWMERFEFPSFLRHFETLKLTTAFTVPPILLLMAKSPLVKPEHFSFVRNFVGGAAPLGKELQKSASDKLGLGSGRSVWINQTWGLSESTGSSTAFGGDEIDTTGSVGRLLPNIQARIIDDVGNDVPADGQTPGEVLIKGPIVTKGYHENVEATRDAISKDGWLYTGDVGFFKNDLLYIVDRKKELIKYKGHQVAPAELEALLISNEGILDAAVIGVWNEAEHTEVPKAYVVVPKGTLTAEDIQAFVAGRVAGYKKLRGGVEFVDAIPKSPSGKILRKDLRDWEKARTKSISAKL